MRILSLFLICFFAFSANAQVLMGLEGGLVNSTLLVSSESDNFPNPDRLKRGPLFGFELEVFIGKLISLEGGLQASNQGYTIDLTRFDPSGSRTGEYTATFAIVELPLNVLFNYQEDRYRIFGGFGASRLFVSSGSSSFVSSGGGGGFFFPTGPLPDIPVRELLRDTDYATDEWRSNYIFGFAFKRKLKSIELKFQHQRGHSNMIQSSGIYETGYSRAWGVSLGIKFLVSRPD